MEATGQLAWEYKNGEYFPISLPCPNSEILPGINWGLAEEIFSPAFWKYQAHICRQHRNYSDFKLGRSLLEEVSVCLLGGYGMPAELGLAAFNRLKRLKLLDGYASTQEIEDALTRPFILKNKPRKYRFAKQKSRYLSQALATLRHSNPPKDHRECRDYLTTLTGIGPKTASWIVRNHFGSDDVAILDIHIIRAGVTVGFFEGKADPAKKYYYLENLFLIFCRALGEPASLVDAIMWDYMRRIGPTRKNGVLTT